MSNKTALSFAPLTVLLALLAGCQPSPEERLDKARSYVNDADVRAAAIELRNVLADLGDGWKPSLCRLRRLRLTLRHGRLELAESKGTGPVAGDPHLSPGRLPLRGVP